MPFAGIFLLQHVPHLHVFITCFEIFTVIRFHMCDRDGELAGEFLCQVLSWDKSVILLYLTYAHIANHIMYL